MTENEAKGNNSVNSLYTKNIPHTETCEKCLYIKSLCKCNKSDTNAGCIGINEAQEYLLNRYLVVGSPANPPKEECEKHNAVLDIAIQALEEIQAYRAIGTIEELKKTVAFIGDDNYSIVDELKLLNQYRAIGTVAEVKALKEKSVAKKPTCVSMAKDKDTAVGSIGRCPCCNYIVAEDMLWCDDCGQKLDWE